MKAEEMLAQGRLAEALDLLQQDVRQKPSDPKLRVFLFQLLAVMGNWERALQQLDVSAQLDPAAMLMAQMCRQAILCEAMRASVFRGERLPLLMGEPEEWIGLMLQAAQLTGQGKHAQAAGVRAAALERAPTSAGTIEFDPPPAPARGDRPAPAKTETASFEWIADADSRLGPMLEAVVEGKYYWIPWSRIREVKIEPPTDLRDAVWTPAVFTWSSGGTSVGIIPTRYPESEKSADGLIALGRKTEFVQKDGDTFIGLGQRLVATDQSEYPLFQVRRVAVTPA